MLAKRVDSITGLTLHRHISLSRCVQRQHLISNNLISLMIDTLDGFSFLGHFMSVPVGCEYNVESRMVEGIQMVSAESFHILYHVIPQQCG